MAAASATAASTPRAAPAPRATRRTPTPRHGALAGLTSSRAIRAAAAGASQDVAVDGTPARASRASRDARPVPPAKGPGSAAAALQEASHVEELLAAASLLVLPAEESAHWHAQSLHRAKRRGAASRALVRLARWLAPESNLGAGGAREACVSDARFARLVEAAACAYPEDGDETPSGPRRDAELELATDAFRALGSLAPMPTTNAKLANDAASIGARVAGLDRNVTDFERIPPHRASVGAWACARLGLDPRSATAKAFRAANRATPFRVLPNLIGGHRDAASDEEEGSSFRDDSNDREDRGNTPHQTQRSSITAMDHLDASVAGGWTSAADILAAAPPRAKNAKRKKKRSPPRGSPNLASPAAGINTATDRDETASSLSTTELEELLASLSVASLAKEVPFKTERLVTRTGARVDERRETCWMADEGVGGLAYSGKVMRPTPFTPTVDALRELVYEKTGQRFDCALLNLYPERSAACAYHKDPDLGRLWARDSVIVSVGETRRFAFREERFPTSARGGKQKSAYAPEHWFRVRGGDAVWMFGDCNDAWEHCVMPGESEGPDAGGAGDGFPAPDAPRASVVFKRSLATGARGGARGAAGESRRSRNRNGRGRGGGSNPGRGELARGGRGRRKSDGSDAARRRGRGGG